MPASLLIHFFPQQELSRSAASGRWVHGLIFELFNRLDPVYAATLHDNKGDRPFTLSPILVNTKGNTIQSGQICRVRLTLLQEEKLAELLSVLARIKPYELRLGNTSICLEKIELSPQPELSLVAYQTWSELLALTPQRYITLKWLSPTAIKQKSRNSLFPVPETIFWSWQQKWSHYSTIPLLQEFSKDEWFEYTQVNNYQLETTTAYFGAYKQKGFKGWASYEIKGNEAIQHTAAVLSRFAFYCGTGYKTTIGMGQTVKQK